MNASAAPRRHLIITVHGIRTFGQWQERLEALVREREPHAQAQHYKYGYFSSIAFMIPPLRLLVTRRFRRALVAACSGAQWDRVDVVAHSFGTHLAAWALHGIPRGERPKLHTLILAGSVLKPSFPWQDLTGECVGRVVNDCGTKDTVLVLNQATVLFTGMAGRVGFAGMNHDRFRNRYFAHGHSDYFLRGGMASDEFMRTWWLPALCTDESPALPPDPRDATTLQCLAAFVLNNAEPIKVAFVLAPFVVLTLLFFSLYREADAQRANARQRLVALQVANAEKLTDDGEVATSLPWNVEALRTGGPEVERDQRVRIAMALRQHPRLMHMLFLEDGHRGLAEFSPDGSLLAIGCGSGIRVWDVEAGVARTPLLAHENLVTSIRFSPDNSSVATASRDHTARIWNARDGTPITGPLAHDEDVKLAHFHPSGELLLTVAGREPDGRSRARLWNARSGTLVHASMSHDGGIEDAVFSPGGERVATISQDGTTRIWNTSSGDAACPTIASGDEESYIGSRMRVAFGADGRRIATSTGVTIHAWDAQTGASLGGPWTLGGCADVAFVDEDTVLAVDADGTSMLWVVGKAGQGRPFPHGGWQASSLSLSRHVEPTGPRLAIARRDGIARVARARTADWVTPPLRHAGFVEFTSISEDARRLVTIDGTHCVRIWDLASHPPVVLEHTPSEIENIWSASFSPDGSRVLSIARDLHTARVWDMATCAPLFDLPHAAAVESASFSPDGRIVLTASRDKTARLRDARTGEPVGAVMQHDSGVVAASFSCDGTRVVTGCEDGTVHVWSASDGSALEPVIQRGSAASIVGFPRDGQLVFVATEASARLFDGRTGEQVTAGPPQTEVGLDAAALSPDGRRIATGDRDGIARVWDAITGEPITPPMLHSGGPKYANFAQRIHHVEFSPDSRLLATSSDDTTTRIWNAATGALAAPPIADAASASTFSPDGRWLATAGMSGLVRVWDVRTGAAVSPPFRHDGVATCVAFDARGLRLLSSSLDGTVRLWDLTPDERPLDELRALAEVLACQRLDETGGLIDLTTEEVRQRWESIALPKSPR